jgi:hypothetical protein
MSRIEERSLRPATTRQRTHDIKMLPRSNTYKIKDKKGVKITDYLPDFLLNFAK